MSPAEAVLAAVLPLLPAEHRPTVPVLVVDPARLSAPIAAGARGACAFVIPPAPRAILLVASCAHVREARRTGDRLALAAVAATIAHEQAHVRGADERAARIVELAVFRRLAESLPAAQRGEALAYARRLEARINR